MTYPEKCPKCGSGAVTAPCRVWVEFFDQKDGRRRVDQEDLDSAEVIPGTGRECRSCGHEWKGE